MTTTEIETEVMAQTGATSTEARTRINRLINRVYKRVTASMGMQLSRRTLAVSATVAAGAQTATFTSCEKVVRVWLVDADGHKTFPRLVTHDELRDSTPSVSDVPTQYAIQTNTATSVTVLLNTVADDGYTLYADVYAVVTTLSTTATPAFPESFHEILVEGALELEYKRLHNKEARNEAKAAFESMLSDLRMWYAKSGYLDTRAGARRARYPFRHPGEYS